MAKYAYTTTLTKATPTVDNASGVVKSWELEFTLASKIEDSIPYSHNYIYRVTVNGKLLSEYTRADIEALIPSSIFDGVFEAHYEAFSGNVNTAATSTIASVSFDISTLD